MTLQETLTRLRDEKHREFWVNYYPQHKVHDVVGVAHESTERAAEDRTGDCKECIHVIEYKAYEKEKQRVDLLLPLIEKMKGALEFYGDSFKIMDHIHGTYEIENDWYFKAREALSELKKIEEGLGK